MNRLAVQPILFVQVRQLARPTASAELPHNAQVSFRSRSLSLSYFAARLEMLTSRLPVLDGMYAPLGTFRTDREMSVAFFVVSPRGGGRNVAA